MTDTYNLRGKPHVVIKAAQTHTVPFYSDTIEEFDFDGLGVLALLEGAHVARQKLAERAREGAIAPETVTVEVSFATVDEAR
jgi:hypothetical protein